MRQYRRIMTLLRRPDQSVGDIYDARAAGVILPPTTRVPRGMTGFWPDSPSRATIGLPKGGVLVIRLTDYDDIIVTVAHPWADVETTLRAWIETGPGLVRSSPSTKARRRNGDPVLPT
jgi:hypothetical protein